MFVVFEFCLLLHVCSVELSIKVLFMVCRERGTGKYDKFYEEGVYNCAGCDTPLYKSTTKFKSGCGWPAFFEGLPGAINRSVSIGHLFVHSSGNVNVNFRFCF